MATAAKKPAAKKTTAIVKWDEALAKKAQIAKKAESSVSTGQWISFKSGQLAYAGNPVAGNKMEVVIVDYVLENNLFQGKYDSSSPQSPVCYAFGRDDDEMAPHEAVEEPQSDKCKGCPHNEFGSAEQGRGKACKNQRRVAVIPADALNGGEEAIKDAQVAYLKVPVTSVKGWAAYVNSLASTNKPPLAFVTEISVVPDADTQFKVGFKAREEIDDGELLGALLAKSDAVEQQIVFPYQKVEEQPAQKGRGRAAPKPAIKRGTEASAKSGKAAIAAKTSQAKRKY